MAGLDWLIARPIAHRGLHDAAAGIIENTQSAIEAAVAAGYAIEVDLQVTADGDAVVHHDEVLGRVTDGRGRIDALTAAELRRVPFRAAPAPWGWRCCAGARRAVRSSSPMRWTACRPPPRCC